MTGNEANSSSVSGAARGGSTTGEDGLELSSVRRRASARSTAESCGSKGSP